MKLRTVKVLLSLTLIASTSFASPQKNLNENLSKQISDLVQSELIQFTTLQKIKYIRKNYDQIDNDAKQRNGAKAVLIGMGGVGLIAFAQSIVIDRAKDGAAAAIGLTGYATLLYALYYGFIKSSEGADGTVVGSLCTTPESFLNIVRSYSDEQIKTFFNEPCLLDTIDSNYAALRIIELSQN
jgi:hypothetical protein